MDYGLVIGVFGMGSRKQSLVDCMVRGVAVRHSCDPDFKMENVNWALAAIEQGRWAIRPDSLAQIIAIASRGEAGAFNFPRTGEGGYEGREALLTRDGVRGPSQGVTLHQVNGKTVAHMEVVGPIFRRANMMTSYSGASSLGEVAQAYRAIENDSKIDSTVISWDSPGGEITGGSEMAQMIANSSKPVVSFVEGSCDSLALWIASASDQIIISPTGDAGSVGVIMTMRDTKAQEGTYRFVSSNAPHKVPDPSDDKDAKRLRAEVDLLGRIFANDVAKYRGVSVETVENDFGKGGVLIGADAVKVGMADGVGTLETAMALASTLAGTKKSASNNSTKKAMEQNTEIQASVDELTKLNQANADKLAEVTAQLEQYKVAAAAAEDVARKAQEDAEKTRMASVAKDAKGFALGLMKQEKVNPASASLIEQTYVAFANFDHEGVGITAGETTGFVPLLAAIFDAKELAAETNRIEAEVEEEDVVLEATADAKRKDAEKDSELVARFNARRNAKSG